MIPLISSNNKSSQAFIRPYTVKASEVIMAKLFYFKKLSMHISLAEIGITVFLRSARTPKRI